MKISISIDQRALSNINKLASALSDKPNLSQAFTILAHLDKLGPLTFLRCYMPGVPDYVIVIQRERIVTLYQKQDTWTLCAAIPIEVFHREYFLKGGSLYHYSLLKPPEDSDDIVPLQSWSAN